MLLASNTDGSDGPLHIVLSNRRKRWFTPEKAMEYGLIDKIVDKGLEMEKKDYETMLQMAQARAQGYSPAAPAGGAAGM